MQVIEMLSEYEMERGKPMPSKNHGVLQALLIGAFLKYKDKYTVASELTIELETGSLTPDICIYPKLKVDWIHDEIRMREMPLLVVEILSPRQYLSDLMEKMELYFAAGVVSGWLVQPTLKSIVVFTPDMNATVYVAGEMSVPTLGITINLDEVFG